ncbi:hypothetical protein F5884DRAFT_296475 [Xylogone sp. PMI_703]|nr:hypothetical protein F5884DRAFT_296475 [Xylogone sp. PMI_703]
MTDPAATQVLGPSESESTAAKPIFRCQQLIITIISSHLIITSAAGRLLYPARRRARTGLSHDEGAVSPRDEEGERKLATNPAPVAAFPLLQLLIFCCSRCHALFFCPRSLRLRLDHLIRASPALSLVDPAIKCCLLAHANQPTVLNHHSQPALLVYLTWLTYAATVQRQAAFCCCAISCHAPFCFALIAVPVQQLYGVCTNFTPQICQYGIGHYDLLRQSSFIFSTLGLAHTARSVLVGGG